MHDTFKLLLNLSLIPLLVACSRAPSTENTAEQEQKKSEQNSLISAANNGFNPKTLPQITQDIGEFPYVGVPEGYQLLLPAAFQPHDYYYFPINGRYYKFEGKLAKISVATNASQQYSNYVFVKMLDETMSNLGAKKLNDQKMDMKFYNEIADKEEWHAISGKQEAIHTYGFINPQGNPVIIQYGIGSGPGYTVMEIQSLKNTMKFGKTAQVIADESNSSMASTLINPTVAPNPIPSRSTHTGPQKQK